MDVKIKPGDIVIMKEDPKHKYKVIAYIYDRKLNELVDLKDIKTSMEYYEVPVEKIKLYLPEFK